MASTRWAQSTTISTVRVPRCLVGLLFSYFPRLKSLIAINIVACTLPCAADITTTQLQESALSSRDRLCALLLLWLIKLPWPTRRIFV